MQISRHFQRFIFGVVLRDLKASNGVLRFENPRFFFRTGSVKAESIRNLLKYLDFEYPRDENMIPLSYTKLTTEQMTAHVRWIERQAAMSGIELDYIEKEWQRVLRLSKH